MILGIDAARNQTGWALMAENERLVTTGVIKIDHSGGDHRTALSIVRDELTKVEYVANVNGVEIAGVFIESAYLGPSARVAIAHSQWIGNVEAIAWRIFKYALIEMMPPREWRSALGIKGTGKSPVKEYVTDKYPDGKDRTQDEDDAICIALAGQRKVEPVA